MPKIRFFEWFSNHRKAQAFLVNMAETLQSYFREALNNIDLNLVSHRYVSGVLKEDHFVSARLLLINRARIISAKKNGQWTFPVHITEKLFNT